MENENKIEINEIFNIITSMGNAFEDMAEAMKSMNEKQNILHKRIELLEQGKFNEKTTRV